MKKRIGVFAKGLLLKTLILLLAASCSRNTELSEEEWQNVEVSGVSELLAQTVSRPLIVPRTQAFVPGTIGGIWNSAEIDEPKTFNILVADRDATSSSMVGNLQDNFAEYDRALGIFTPRIATWEITVNEAAGTVRIVYTLRDNLYWSYYNSTRKVPVTSDDVVFWYDEIEGNPDFQSIAYSGQFIDMPDGTRSRITVEKIDDKRFAFNIPRTHWSPVFTTNMNFGPRHIYEPALRQGGVQGVRDLHGINVDVKTIPSMGPFFITEYAPGQRIVLERNPDFWENENPNRRQNREQVMVNIVPEQSTQLLLFREGRLDSYLSRPEDVDTIIGGQNREHKTDGYTVFNNGGSLQAGLWTFNQNPVNKDQPYYEWFTQKEFRQAMSCLFDRDRTVLQAYRGLGRPKLDFYTEVHPYYNPDIKLQYTFNPQKAVQLLASIGINRDTQGVMRDSQGREIEFNVAVPSGINIWSDIASIIIDEASKVGIKINLRPTDFQLLVDQLTTTFDWQSIMLTVAAPSMPGQGTNVWPSRGNLHMWYPYQETPATEWEARVDYLFNEGSFTIDPEKAQAIWDEKARIILEQLPLIYLIRPTSFLGLQNRWDFRNFYYDNWHGGLTSYIFLEGR